MTQQKQERQLSTTFLFSIERVLAIFLGLGLSGLFNLSNSAITGLGVGLAVIVLASLLIESRKTGLPWHKTLLAAQTLNNGFIVLTIVAVVMLAGHFYQPEMQLNTAALLVYAVLLIAGLGAQTMIKLKLKQAE